MPDDYFTKTDVFGFLKPKYHSQHWGPLLAENFDRLDALLDREGARYTQLRLQLESALQRIAELEAKIEGEVEEDGDGMA